MTSVVLNLVIVLLSAGVSFRESDKMLYYSCTGNPDNPIAEQYRPTQCGLIPDSLLQQLVLNCYQNHLWREPIIGLVRADTIDLRHNSSMLISERTVQTRN